MSEIKKVLFTTVNSTAATTTTTTPPTTPLTAPSNFFRSTIELNDGGSSSFSVASSASTSVNIPPTELMSGSVGPTTHNNNKKSPTRTIRIKVQLSEPNSNSFPEYNYSRLISIEKKKQKLIKQKKQESNGTSDPFNDNNDGDVARIAREMELKYGNQYNIGRSKSKSDDFYDKGMGYDDSDSFIDNTEAYDELIPDEVEAIGGGFYINSGQLEFKQLTKYEQETEEIVKMVRNANKKKRALSTSSEESDSVSGSMSENNGETTLEDKQKKKDEKKKSFNAPKLKNGHQDKKLKSIIDEVDLKNKKHEKKLNKMPKTAELNNGISESNINTAKEKPTIKTTTVKDMLKAKRDNFLKMQETKNVRLNGETVSNDYSSSSSGDSATDSENDVSEKKSATEDDNLRTIDVKLPDGIGDDLLNDIKSLKEIARISNRLGKNFQFDDKTTEIFLRIDDAALCLEDKTIRNQINGHLEFHLGLAKNYLVRRAKQIRIKLEKNKTRKALAKLKKSVNDVMPSALQTYDVNYKKVIEIRASIPPEDLARLEHPPKFPKKKFPWNDAVRGYLLDLYQIRWTSYIVLKTRKQSFEDFVTGYLKQQVVPIWPCGWMKYEDIKKEIDRRRNASVSKKTKENKKQSSSVNAIAHSTEKIKCSENVRHLDAIECLPSKSILSSNALLPNSKDLSITLSSGNHCDSSKVPSTDNLVSITPVISPGNISSENISRKCLLDKEHAIKTECRSPNSSKNDTIHIIDLSSPPKRTDHSINSIISTSPIKDNNIAVTKTTAHIITVDNFKNTTDIIQTSNKILQNKIGYNKDNNSKNNKNNNSNSISSDNYKSSSSTNNKRDVSPLRDLANRRDTIDSIGSSGSDSIEITGIYPAQDYSQQSRRESEKTSQFKKISKKNKSRSSSPDIIILTNVKTEMPVKLESIVEKNENRNSNSGGTIKLISPLGSIDGGNRDSDLDVDDVMESLKDLEKMQKSGNNKPLSSTIPLSSMDSKHQE